MSAAIGVLGFISQYSCICALLFKSEGIVHLKMKILLFTQVVSNMYGFICSAARKAILNKVCNQAVLGYH